MLKLLRLALKLISRDWRAGELSTLAAALSIAVIAATSVTLLSDRLNRAMTLQAAAFLGADLAVSGHVQPPESWHGQASSLGLNFAETVEFSTVLVENEELLLVGAKAVPAGYPLRGTLKIQDQPESEPYETQASPAPGEAWVEPRILTALKLSLGSHITLGEKNLRITRLIMEEPDRRGDLYSLSPRVIFHREDLDATRVIQPGSHVHYYALFSGETEKLQALKTWLKPQLLPGQRITDIDEDRPELGKAIQRAERYLGLTSLSVVLIAGVAIAMSSRRYTERHFDLMAILKCLGATEREIFTIACLQFLLVGFVVTLFACMAGGLLQAGIVRLIQPLLPHGLPPPGVTAWLLGGGMGLLILTGFALPPVLRLKRLPPLRVLRRDLEPHPSSAWLVYGMAGLTVTVLMWRYTEDWKTTLSVLGGSALLVSVFAATGLTLLRLGQRILRLLPLPARLGMQQLTRRPELGVMQIVGFSVTLVAMLIIFLVRTELIVQWQRQIPPDAPNQFALNLFDGDLETFRAFLERENIRASEIYPIVRGRLIRVNGQEITEILRRDSRAEGAVNRELSLTWSASLPSDNRVVTGAWPDLGPGISVSMEQALAHRLGVGVGDHLTFNIAGQTLDTRIGSLRSVRWDNLTPNFFMIFAPGVLEGYPHTWLTSFHISDSQRPVLTRMIKAFPGLTLLDVGKLISQFQDILHQLTLAIEFVLVLALGAGFTVLFATVRSTIDDRIHEDTLLRAMGAGSALLRGAQWMEFAALGLLSGLLAMTITELIVWLVYWRVFDIPYQPHAGAWLLTPLLSAGVIGGVGVWSIRRVTRASPMRLLREL
ncbi:MAG: ABC transporter permease [Methylococcus sp.]